MEAELDATLGYEKNYKRKGHSAKKSQELIWGIPDGCTQESEWGV